MRLAPKARIRVLRLARHAAVAAGLGVGWLLLGGSSASASSDPAPPIPVSSHVVSSRVTAPPVADSPTQTVSVAVKEVAAALPPAAQAGPAVPPLQGALASAIGTTTTAVGSAAAAAPAAVAPVLQGPLEPLTPVVSDAASGLGGTVTKVGGALSDTAAAPVPVTLPVPVSPPALFWGPEPTAGSGVQAADAPAAASDTAPEQAAATKAAADQTAKTEVSAPQDRAFEVSTGLREDPTAAGTLDWSTLWSAGGLVEQSVNGGMQAPLGAPPVPQPDTPFTPPAGSGTGGASGPTSPAAGTATLAAGFLLAPLFLLVGRARRSRSFLPASPAFDPGSTPD